MKLQLILIALIFSIAFKLSAQQNRPKLLVAIVVDQMRYDYISQFKPEFGEDGFVKLMSQGVNCTTINYPYKPTYTGPGHASIFTGANPSEHGIVANAWYDRLDSSMVYCVAIKTDTGLQYGPYRLKASTLGDQMKKHLGSKVYAVGLKDRSAILPAGKHADGAFWFSSKTGEWQSSDYYSDNNPKAIKEFSPDSVKKNYLTGSWIYSGHQESGVQTADENKYEATLSNRTANYFPYDLDLAFEDVSFDLIKRIPAGNQLTADFAMSLIQEKELGKMTQPDFISISFSATDYIGHRFGIESLEVEDAYIKLDQTIADLISFLDREIGEEEYLIFLSSDHGAAPNPQWRVDHQLDGGFYDESKLKHQIDSVLSSVFGAGEYLRNLSNLNLYFDENLVEEKGLSMAKMLEVLTPWLEQTPEIRDIIIPKGKSKNENFQEMVDKGYFPKKSGDLVLIESKYYLEGPRKGTSHGSAYSYDTHVPLIWYGKGIPQKEIVVAYPISSIVPTACKLLDIPVSESSSKLYIKEIFE